MTEDMPHNPNKAVAVFRREADCETQEWSDSVRGSVQWRTLFSADRTPTADLTVGVAEIPVGAPVPIRGHWHSLVEVYYILSGSGYVWIAGDTTSVVAGDAVFIPGDIEHFAVNTGIEPLRLLYFFPTNSFADVKYEFPPH